MFKNFNFTADFLMSPINIQILRSKSSETKYQQEHQILRIPKKIDLYASEQISSGSLTQRKKQTPKKTPKKNIALL